VVVNAEAVETSVLTTSVFATSSAPEPAHTVVTHYVTNVVIVTVTPDATSAATTSVLATSSIAEVSTSAQAVPATASLLADYGNGVGRPAQPSALRASWIDGEDGFVGGIPAGWVASSKRSTKHLARHRHAHADAHMKRESRDEVEGIVLA
jgi:hypothetical protein